MDYKIISVESRKGGVGKTTAALNLASVLLEQGYAVLFMDIDITGTSIIGAYSTSYWKDRINPIKFEGKDENLLRTFQEKYLVGNEIPEFSLENLTNSWLIDTNKINVLQSEIYEIEVGSTKKGQNKITNLVCDPRILFDELHSFWLSEMLQTICNDFYSLIKNNFPNKRVAIIFDNSPGYVGLAKSIREWLTNIGPINGKFLSISSLDNQDLQSSLQAIDAIDEIIETKKQAVEIFQNLKDDNATKITIPDKLRDIVIQFATKNDNRFDYSVYKHNEILSFYQALIINKVPTLIKNKAARYDFNLLSFKSQKLKNLLLNKSQTQIKNPVYFDNNIYYQFVEPYLKKIVSKSQRSDNWSVLESYFDNIEANLLKNPIVNEDDDFVRLVKTIQFLQETLVNVQNLLSKFKLDNFIELIEKKWYPLSPFEEVLRNFELVVDNYPIYKRDIRYYRSNELLFAHDRAFNKVLNDFYFSLLNKYNIKNGTEKSNSFNLEINVRSMILLTKYVLSRFSSLKVEENKVLFDNCLNIFEQIYYIQQKRYESIKIIGISYKQFLATEEIDESVMFDYYHKSDILKKSKLGPWLLEDDYITDFYNSFCHAQARLIDLNQDFNFLINVIKNIVFESKSNDKLIFPNISDILDKVIVEKSISHANADEELKKGINAAKYMIDFQKVLKSIISDWEML